MTKLLDFHDPHPDCLKMEMVYQVEALKDDYEELGENHRLLQKELKSRTRQHEQLKRDHKELEQEMLAQKLQYDQRFALQAEENTKLSTTVEALQEELERHKTLLEEAEKARLEAAVKQIPVADEIAMTRETNKQTREYHYKWKMAEQENTVLQTSVNRLENQVSRYKESLKEAETVESDLKAEKRKLLRELRESQAKVEELETNNSHLQKRLDRIRSRNLLVGTETAANSTPSNSLNNIAPATTTTTTTPATSATLNNANK